MKGSDKTKELLIEEINQLRRQVEQSQRIETERKKTEEALRDSQARYKAIFETAREGILVAEIETRRFRYANPAICKMLGYTEDELGQMSVSDIHLKEHLALISQYFEAQVRGELILAHNVPCLRKNGTIFYADINSTSVVIDQRPCNVGFFTDITEYRHAEEALRKAHDELETRVRQRTSDLAQTIEKLQKEIAERKRVEESLRKAEERFRTVFENTVVGLYRTTPDGRILLANPALVKMMGYQSFEELAQLNLEKEGFDSSTPRSVFKQRIEEEGKVVGLESVWIRRDGSKLFVSESAFAVRNDNGNILYYEGTAQNITERKNAEEKLLLYQQQLRSLASQLSLAEEHLRRRIATELHDHISQNLAISKIKLESLIDPAKPDLAKSLNEIIDLIAQTIDVTRSLTFEVSPPVLYELGFEAAIGWLAKQTKQRFGLDVEFTDDGKPKPLDTDVRVLLFQAVRELLVNVVKHAKTRKAKISTKRGRGRIQIAVEDDGVGFDVSSINANDYTKGGFGLFNIRERLDHIGGSVNIRSRPGHGTRVTLIAPLLKLKT
jgi:PAS domain S-box-containing protein